MPPCLAYNERVGSSPTENEMAIDASTERASKRNVHNGGTTMEQVFNVFVFVAFLVLWAAFAYALVANQGGLDAVWNNVRGLPLIAQVGIWVLFLPVTLGLWIWETAWPLVVRLPLVIAIAGWNLWMFFPKELVSR